MNDKILYDVVLDLLIGDLKAEDKLVIILNFLDHAKSVIRHLYWSKPFQKDMK
jgi:hypothetical protein